MNRGKLFLLKLNTLSLLDLVSDICAYWLLDVLSLTILSTHFPVYKAPKVVDKRHDIQFSHSVKRPGRSHLPKVRHDLIWQSRPPFFTLLWVRGKECVSGDVIVVWWIWIHWLKPESSLIIFDRKIWIWVLYISVVRNRPRAGGFLCA